MGINKIKNFTKKNKRIQIIGEYLRDKIWRIMSLKKVKQWDELKNKIKENKVVENLQEWFYIWQSILIQKKENSPIFQGLIKDIKDNLITVRYKNEKWLYEEETIKEEKLKDLNEKYKISKDCDYSEWKNVLVYVGKDVKVLGVIEKSYENSFWKMSYVVRVINKLPSYPETIDLEADALDELNFEGYTIE